MSTQTIQTPTSLKGKQIPPNVMKLATHIGKKKNRNKITATYLPLKTMNPKSRPET